MQEVVGEEFEKRNQEILWFDFLKNFASFLIDFAKTIIIVVVIAFLVRFYLVQPFYVYGSSMEPNYVHGEYILINEIVYQFKNPLRGDVVVFKYPLNPSESYIKRIIALPGETIEIKDGGVFIFNKEAPEGVLLKESYLSESIRTEGEIKRTLGEDEYFVLGDNRLNSSDSRFWGVLPRKNILGKSWLVFRAKFWKTFVLGDHKISIPLGIERFGFVHRPIYNLTLALFPLGSFPQNQL